MPDTACFVTIAPWLLPLAGALVLWYVARLRHHPADVWSAPAAWCRAALYCCACVAFAALSGALSGVLQAPLASPAQLADPLWWLATAGLFGFVVAAYWGYWYRNTLRFNRRLDLLPQLVFGLAWGLSTGLLFLSFCYLARWLVGGGPVWLAWLLAYGLISVFQALWMDLYWDVYVSPEHDTPETLRAKVPRTHIPNMTLSILWLACYGNEGLFVLLQAQALVAAAFGMRMPAPWSREVTPPARREPGLFGLPRAGGYLEYGQPDGVQDAGQVQQQAQHDIDHQV